LTVLRNPFSREVKEKLNELIEPAVLKIKSNINVRYVNNAATFINEEALKNQKKLPSSRTNTAEGKTNLKNFSEYLIEADSTIEEDLLKILEEIYPSTSISMSGSFYYPDTGYMGWHTNYQEPCKRLYMVYADMANRSFFRYQEKRKIITDFDDKGLTIREFDISGTKPYFWHCVGSTCNRFSFGFRIEN
tara:strand:- start:217 stop:786 length:570 start_codon:yes stop_codon:yes gene_type:complete